jgi:hypothetical protein
MAADVADTHPGGADAPDTVTVSKGVDAPSAVKATVPDGSWVGVVLGGRGQTVALKVTFWPNTDGLADETIVVAVGARLTV